MRELVRCIPFTPPANTNTLPGVEHDPSDTPTVGAREPRSRTVFESTDGKYTVNIWACDAGTLEIDNLAIDEACFILDGEVIVTDDEGTRSRFGPGDSFVLPKGFCGTWEMPRGLLKYNTMYAG